MKIIKRVTTEWEFIATTKEETRGIIDHLEKLMTEDREIIVDGKTKTEKIRSSEQKPS